jgi:hypothetical protein
LCTSARCDALTGKTIKMVLLEKLLCQLRRFDTLAMTEDLASVIFVYTVMFL